MIGARRLLSDLLEFCYPATCSGCRAPCPAAGFLCDECESSLQQLEAEPACPCCAMPLSVEGSPCPQCRGKGVPHYEKIVALGCFAPPLSELIHHMKYHGRWPLAEHLASRLLKQDCARALLAQADVLIPVPLHRLRQMLRGYNQAEVIASRLAQSGRLRVIQPVVRTRYTAAQTQQHSRIRRFGNLRKAFRLKDPQAIRGQRVLVIDDVMTTGATLQTLARVLRPAKPAQLSALVIAAADPRRARS